MLIDVIAFFCLFGFSFSFFNLLFLFFSNSCCVRSTNLFKLLLQQITKVTVPHIVVVSISRDFVALFHKGVNSIFDLIEVEPSENSTYSLGNDLLFLKFWCAKGTYRSLVITCHVQLVEKFLEELKVL